MTPEVLSSYPEIQKIHVAEVIRYLQQHHWMSVSHPSHTCQLKDCGNEITPF
jgi:hypothetical protein